MCMRGLDVLQDDRLGQSYETNDNDYNNNYWIIIMDHNTCFKHHNYIL